MIDKHILTPLIKNALEEDIGSGDITSKLLIPEDMQADIVFAARQDMTACGTFIPAAVYSQLSSRIRVEPCTKEGQQLASGMVMVEAHGPAREILTGERVVLNIMQRLSGVATLTRAYVDAVKGTKAVILDTRKTMPGLRALDKYAVTVGGGHNHRMRLDDMVLIKDNHIALSGGIASAIGKARTGSKLPVTVECDTLKQVSEALAAAPDRILLDNMDTATLKKAVALAAGKVPLEASGGVSLENVKAIAKTGVDFISIGKLTHSAPGADIGADVLLRETQKP